MESRPLVLVVDDDPSVRELLSEVLTVRGYHVATASDAISAFARIARGGIDLVLLDIMLPVVNGIEVCEELRAREATCCLPVIMVTALGDAPQRQAAYAAGANDYIVKPFDVDELLERVELWAGTQHSLRAARTRLAPTSAD